MLSCLCVSWSWCAGTALESRENVCLENFARDCLMRNVGISHVALSFGRSASGRDRVHGLLLLLGPETSCASVPFCASRIELPISSDWSPNLDSI